MVMMLRMEFENCRRYVREGISVMNGAVKEDMRELAVRLIEEHREATEVYVR